MDMAMAVARLLLILVALAGTAVGQQPYVRNMQLACENPANDNNITRGFRCNGARPSCQSYITFRSNPPSYSSAAAISSLLGSQPAAIVSINGLSSADANIPVGNLVIVPVNCSCSNSFYQHNASHTIQASSRTYFLISNDTFQGLTTCQAMEAQNSISFRNLRVGNRLLVPLRCACPTPAQLAAGSNYLLTYTITWGDTSQSIAQTFRSDPQRVQQANQLSASDTLFPFNPLLVPLSSEPTGVRPPPPSPSQPPPPPLIPTGGGSTSSDNKGVFIGVGVAAAVLLILGLAGGFLFWSRRRKPKSPVPVSHKPETGFADKSKSTSWPLSSSAPALQFAIESLTIYKFEDLQAATGNFSESNRIKGSAYRGTFMGDDAAVKVMKGDVSDEINLLKMINHTNIVRLSGFCLHQGSSYLVYEYAENGSVTDWLQPTEKNKAFHVILSWKQRVQIAYDAADALNYLHHYITPPYVHKNLKSSNVLLDSNFRAKIANFGLARNMQNDNDGGEMQLTRHVIGTQGYMALEYIENGVITPKLDVFAFGVVMLELLSGREAAVNVKNSGEELLYVTIRWVLEGENVREKLKGFIDPALEHEYPLELAFSMTQLARNCVAHDLNARPSMSEVQMMLSKMLSSSLDWDPSVEFERSMSLDSAR